MYCLCVRQIDAGKNDAMLLAMLYSVRSISAVPETIHQFVSDEECIMGTSKCVCVCEEERLRTEWKKRAENKIKMNGSTFFAAFQSAAIASIPLNCEEKKNEAHII